MIKAVFFDIDGTLLSPIDGNLVTSTRYALQTLQKQGIKIFIASGRHLCEIKEQPIHDIKFDGYVCLNGQLIFDQDKKLIFGYPIDEQDTKNIVTLFNEKKIPIVLVEEDQLYINFANDYVKIAQNAIASDIPLIKPYKGKTIYQITAFSNNEETNFIMKQLNNCKMTRWNPYGIDIISNIGGKAFGIEKILEYHGLTKDTIMAFGDGENDMDMLKEAHIGVAMANAEDMVKEVADYVTDTSQNDGIYKALKHFNIIEK